MTTPMPYATRQELESIRRVLDDHMKLIEGLKDLSDKILKILEQRG